MKVVFSGLFVPSNETVSCADIPWCRTPCQTGNGTIIGKGHVFEVLSNGLGIAKVMVLTYKAIKGLLKRSSANLLKVDGEQVGNRRMNRRFIDNYFGWFPSLCKRIGRGEFFGRQLNEAFRFQDKQQASANHVLEEPIRLSPIPLSTNFLRNEAAAFIRVCLNNPYDGCDIFPRD